MYFNLVKRVWSVWKSFPTFFPSPCRVWEGCVKVLPHILPLTLSSMRRVCESPSPHSSPHPVEYEKGVWKSFPTFFPSPCRVWEGCVKVLPHILPLTLSGMRRVCESLSPHSSPHPVRYEKGVWKSFPHILPLTLSSMRRVCESPTLLFFFFVCVIDSQIPCTSFIEPGHHAALLFLGMGPLVCCLFCCFLRRYERCMAPVFCGTMKIQLWSQTFQSWIALKLTKLVSQPYLYKSSCFPSFPVITPRVAPLKIPRRIFSGILLVWSLLIKYTS